MEIEINMFIPIYPTNYHSATFHCVGVENTGVNLISALLCHDMAICGRYCLKYSYIIEEPPETDDIVIRGVTQMPGIR